MFIFFSFSGCLLMKRYIQGFLLCVSCLVGLILMWWKFMLNGMILFILLFFFIVIINLQRLGVFEVQVFIFGSVWLKDIVWVFLVVILVVFFLVVIILLLVLSSLYINVILLVVELLFFRFMFSLKILFLYVLFRVDVIWKFLSVVLGCE